MSLFPAKHAFEAEEVAPGVFVADGLLSADQREAWLEAAEEQRDRTDRPNSMNKYGVILADGLREALHELQERVVWPLASARYPEFHRGFRKHPYAFTIDYDCAPRKQRSLAKHADSSDVTLNVCLQFRGAGGDLVFYRPSGKKLCVVQHAPGRAIIHRGKLTHRALPLTNGTRTNLVLWCAAKRSR